MSAFRPVALIEETDEIEIPIHKSSGNVYLLWREEETVEDIMKRHGPSKKYVSVYSSFKVWPVGEDSGEYSETKVTVYEIRCHRTSKQYYLIVYDKLHEYDDIFHAVAVPFHNFNLMEFYKDYLVPLSGKPYVNGD